MGYRLALVGGSDIICLNNTVGSPRTLALVDGPLSYDAYLDAIRRGRTAVAGKKHNRMDMRVDGARLGSEITLAEPSDLTIDIDSELEEAATAQILVNGIAVRELALPAGPHLERTTVRAERSSWISARTRRVQTSAVYAILAGHPIRASASRRLVS